MINRSLSQGYVVCLSLSIAVSLMGCSPSTRAPATAASPSPAGEFHQWKSRHVMAAFAAARLAATTVHPQNELQDDTLSTVMQLGPLRFTIPSVGGAAGRRFVRALSPVMLVDIMRFIIPSPGGAVSGEILSFYAADDLQWMRSQYPPAEDSSLSHGLWTYTKANIVLQIQGSLPEAEASKYEAALNALEH